MQTGASAGASIAAGVIFTLPALVIIGYWKDFNYWWVLAIAGLGGLLGVLFSVPLRRALIVEQKLAFPEGKAAAEVLKAGENPGRGIKILGVSALIGGIGKLLAPSGLRLLPDSALGAARSASAFATSARTCRPRCSASATSSGSTSAIVIVAGGVLSWDIAIPIYTQYFMDTGAALRRSREADRGTRDLGRADPLSRRRRDARRRHLDAVLAALTRSLSGVTQRPRRGARRHDEVIEHTEKDLPMKCGADRTRRVHAAAGGALPGDRRTASGRRFR